MSDPTSNVGMNIRKLRLEKQWTQQELGDGLNVSPQAVSKWEHGSTTPDIELLPLLAQIFNVKIDDLFRADCLPLAVDLIHSEITEALCPDCSGPLLNTRTSCSVCHVRWMKDESHCGVCHTSFKQLQDCHDSIQKSNKKEYPNLFQSHDWGKTCSQFVQSDNLPPASLISNVNMVPFIDDKCILIQLDNGKWEIPGGTLEAGESFIAALKRELLEEAGAELVSEFTVFGAWKFISSAEEPYRPHLPHPIYYRVVGYGDVQLVCSPIIPEDGEKVIAVKAKTLEEAKHHFYETGRPDLAELYELAWETRRSNTTPDC